MFFTFRATSGIIYASPEGELAESGLIDATFETHAVNEVPHKHAAFLTCVTACCRIPNKCIHIVLGNARRVTYVTTMLKSHPVSAEVASRGAVHHPDLGLAGAPRDRLELYQEHIIKLHEALTNLPLFVGGPVYSVRALRLV